MTNTPAGPPSPAGPTGPGADGPDPVERAGRPDETDYHPGQQSYGPPAYGPSPYANPYNTTPFGTTTPYGHLPPFAGPPAGPESAGQRGGSSRARRLAVLAAVAVIAAAVGGAVGGVVGRQSATSAGSPLDTLNQSAPSSAALPAGAITQVANKVLPSVVQLAGSSGEGSGVVLSADGLILTNAHVLGAGGENGTLTATFQNGTTAPIQVVGSDTASDIAVVRAQHATGLTPIQLGNSDQLQVGQQVVAIGSPLGLSGTVTSGIVSALNRPVTTEQEPKQTPGNQLGGLDGFGGFGGLSGLVVHEPAKQTSINAIQTDAAINPGNSGGPLVDMQGRIVGLNSAIASLGSAGDGQSGSIGLGFSIPINQVKRIADELVATGHAQQAQLGVQVKDAMPNGAQVISVQPSSAAAKAGLQQGDLITKVGDLRVEDANALVAAINSRAPNSTVPLTVSTGAGAPRSVPVTLGSVTAP
jgi:putative serine protease PepD